MAQSSLIRQGVLSTVGVAVQGLARFGYSILIARFVGAEPLALVNTLISLSIILSLLWPTAAGNAAGTFLARAVRNDRAPQRVLGLVWKSTGLACLAISIIGVLVAVIVIGTEPAEAVGMVALTLAWSAYILTRGIRMGLGQVTAAAVWDSISAAVSIGLLVAVIALDATALLLWPLTIGYALFALAAVPAMRRTGRALAPDRTTAPGDIWHLVAWNSLGLIATNGLIQFSMVWAFATASAEESGMFAAAIALATPASMLAQAVSQVLIPRYAHWLEEDPVQARRHHLRVLSVMTGVLVVAFGTVAWIAPWFIPLLYGPGFDAAVPLMRLLLIGVFLFSVGLIASSFLITSWRAMPATIAAGVGSVLGILAMAVATPGLGGAIGAAVGVIVGTAVSAALAVGWSLRTPTAPSRAAESPPGSGDGRVGELR
ncbi:lipopolysaccharide biosynthesis protein [Agromyces albus]|uniref:Lipopolysaccharide biosynthesis protein n=1 Tax=Agromyces albus TaxID=205332 RepID=A0A4Q2L1V0_9MICO|nr:lipopolysaccharide biosynthesis protein [Agromyces albus]RXZ72058.1 lipopolysaccharide biosynthesis protein [Agromyces albus]